MKLRHFVLPHPKTHKKAHLFAEKSLVIYLLFFIVLQSSFQGIAKVQPGVLGTTSSITAQQIITLTNEQRQKFGDAPVKENTKLDQAAEAKAKNMFAQNYWAHNSPSGITPWYWIQQAGYDYEYAGENLARGYETAPDVMTAWMNSKMGHRENLLSKNYQDIGIAVEDGILDGVKTTLVVQEFGTQVGAAAADAQIPRQAVSSAKVQAPPSSFLSKYIYINPVVTIRSLGFMILGLLVVLAVLDFNLIRKNKKILVKVHLRYLPHVALVVLMMLALLVIRAGSII